MDFDDVKRAWDEYDQKLAGAIRLNARRLRSIVTTRTDASADRPAVGDVDYTVPVVLMQEPLHSRRVIDIVQAVASSIRDRGRANDIVARFEEIVMRLLRRVRALRSEM